MIMGSVIPMVVEQDGRWERSFDIYSRLLRERIVFLGQEGNDDIANVIAAQLLHLDRGRRQVDRCHRFAVRALVSPAPAHGQNRSAFDFAPAPWFAQRSIQPLNNWQRLTTGTA